MIRYALALSVVSERTRQGALPIERVSLRPMLVHVAPASLLL